MSITNKHREKYFTMTKEEQTKIDEIYNVVNEHCKQHGIRIAYDDRAENFVGAIIEYLESSKN